MSTHDDGLSFIVIPNGTGESRSLSLSRRQVWVFGVAGTLLAAATIVMLASWVSVARRALQADDLALQVDTLQARQIPLERIAAKLARLESQQDTYKQLLGLSAAADSALWVPTSRGVAGGDESLAAGNAGTEPTAWPLTVPGVLTREHLGGAAADHPGIDLAVASGSYVRAAGDGVVVEAAEDPVYGLFILIDHGNGFRSRYGHALYLVPERGWQVRQGEVIALSGSTGRSTAPHLHFEILKNGRPVDPLSMVTPP